MLKLPSPQELNFPEKFDSWRPGQVEFVNSLLYDTRRVTSACAPTAFGKSGAYMLWAILTKEPTCFVTDNRGLQDQLMDDFARLGLVDLRGRNNYTCDMKEDYTCEDGYAARCPYKGTVACPSSQAEMRAATSSLVTTNYAKWITSKRFGTGMSHFKQVVFDEGHKAFNALASAMQVTFHYREIEQGLKVSFPTINVEEFSGWKDWCVDTRTVAEDAMIEAKNRLQSVRDPKPSWVRHYLHMRSLWRKLGLLSTASSKDWVVEQVEDGYQFDPIKPGRYSESTLLLRMPRIVITSATLTPKTMFQIGISSGTFTFHEFDSDFNPRDCPIYWIPTQRIDRRTSNDWSMLWMRNDQVTARRRDKKSIFHTVSYVNRDLVLENSRFWESMLINPKGEPPTKMIEEFKKAGPGTILVSPSIGDGYDFPGTDCEFQIMFKVPFAPPSKILKAREADDPDYRGHDAVQKMVQAFGRGARYKGDRCENFIFDDHMEWFWPSNKHHAPRSFRNFFRRADVLPQPLPKI